MESVSMNAEMMFVQMATSMNDKIHQTKRDFDSEMDTKQSSEEDDCELFMICVNNQVAVV